MSAWQNTGRSTSKAKDIAAGGRFAVYAFCAVLVAVLLSIASLTAFGTEDATESSDVSSWSVEVDDGTTVTLALDEGVKAATTADGTSVYGDDFAATVTVVTDQDFDADASSVVDSAGVLDDVSWSQDDDGNWVAKLSIDKSVTDDSIYVEVYATAAADDDASDEDTEESGDEVNDGDASGDAEDDATDTTTDNDTSGEDANEDATDDEVSGAAESGDTSGDGDTDDDAAEDEAASTLVCAVVFGSADDFEDDVLAEGYTVAEESVAFTVDADDPSVTSVDIEGSATSTTTDDGCCGYAAYVTVTVDEAYLDTENSVVVATWGTDGSKTYSTSDESLTWTDNEDGTYTGTLTISYDDLTDYDGSAISLAVYAYDYSTVVYDADATNVTATYPTEDDEAESFTLTNDEDSPTISALVGEDGSEIDDVHAYNTDTDGDDEYDAFQFTIVVTDENLSTGNITVESEKDYEISDWSSYTGTDDEGNEVTGYQATVTVTDEGPYSFTVTAQDSAGNDPVSATLSFTVDAKGPRIEVSGLDDEDGVYAYNTDTDGDGEDDAFALTITLADDISSVSSVTATLNDEDVMKSLVEGDDGTYTLTVTEEDDYTLELTATDTAGNPKTKSYTFSVDATDPDVAATPSYTDGSYDEDADVYYVQGSVTVTFTAFDTYLDADTIEASYTVDDEETSVELAEQDDGSYSAEVTLEEAGTYTFSVTAYDLADHDDSDSLTVVVDKDDVQASVSLPEDEDGNVTYDGYDEESGVYYYQDEVKLAIEVSDSNLDASTIEVLVNDKGLDELKDLYGLDDDDVTLSVSSDGTNGTYKATLTVSADLGETVVVSVSASDKSSKSTDAESAAFVVDTDDVTASAVLQTNSATKTGTDDDGNTTYYFQDEAEVVVCISDNNLDSYEVFVNDTVVVSSDAAVEEVDGVTLSDVTVTDTGYSVTLTVSADLDETVVVSVSASDKAGRGISDDSDPNSDTFVVDTDIPVYTVEDEVGNDFVDGAVYDTAKTVTITVTDKNFSEDCITVNTDGDVDSDEGWYEDSDGNHCLDVTFEEGEEHYLTVSGTDLAGRELHKDSEDGSTDEYSVSFDVDYTAATVAYTLSAEKTGELYVDDSTTVDYFDSTLTLEIKVYDVNLATVTGTWTILGEETDIEFTLSEDGTTATATVEFGENTDDIETTDLMDQLNRVTVTACDKAGHCTVYSYGGKTDETTIACTTTDSSGTALTGAGFVIDCTAPTVEGNANSDGDIANKDSVNSYDSGAFLFYNSATKLAIKVTDALGLASVVVRGYSATISGSEGDTEFTVVIALQDGQEFDDVVLTATDIAGNTTTWSISPTGTTTTSSGTSSQANTTLYSELSKLYSSWYPQALIKDTEKPVLSFSGVTAGSYYNSTQSLTLSIEELNFGYLKDYDSSQVVLTITKVAGNSSGTTTTSTVPVSSITGSGKSWSYTKSFSEDGHYTVVAQVTDPATNTTTITQREFTIDTTDPTISVSWDNESALNGKYYNATRTATITIVEHNFDSSLISIDTNGTVGSWSSSGDTHTITVSFTTDGTYNLSISGADLAGNTFDTYTADEFVVDLTLPTILFKNVEAYTAYNGSIAPQIVYYDEANFDQSGITYTLTGTKNGTVTYTVENGGLVMSSDGTTGTITYADFEDLLSYDDIYTLTASITDLAGNTVEDSITFSVNRYGSTYAVEDAEDYEVDETTGICYLTEAQAVVVTEINVSGAESEDCAVKVSYLAETSTLEQQEIPVDDDGEQITGDELEAFIEEFKETGEGYLLLSDTSTSSSSKGWAEYTYIIGAGNFTEDGTYDVRLTSIDTAGNNNTISKFNNRDVSTDEEVVQDDAHVEFTLDEEGPTTVTAGLESNTTYDSSGYVVTITADDGYGSGVASVTALLDDEEIEVTDNGEGNYSITIPSKSFTERTLVIYATDYVGHVGNEVTISGFHVTTNFIELHMALFIAACVAVLAIIFFVVYKRRKKDEDEETAA